MNIIQVVSAELIIFVTSGSLIYVFKVLSGYIPDAISTRCSVEADVYAWSQISRPPPRSTDGCGVMFVKLMSAGYGMLRQYIIVSVGMSAYKVHFIVFQYAEQLCGVKLVMVECKSFFL